jgi:hypothetical protein
MNELITIHKTIETEHDAGRAVIFASVVHVEGSTYRRPGALAEFIRVCGGAMTEGVVSVGSCLPQAPPPADHPRRCTSRRGVGVPALFPRDTWSELQRLRGGTGARSLLAQHLARTVSVLIPGAQHDVDPWEDLRRVSRRQR